MVWERFSGLFVASKENANKLSTCLSLCLHQYPEQSFNFVFPFPSFLFSYIKDQRHFLSTVVAFGMETDDRWDGSPSVLSHNCPVWYGMCGPVCGGLRGSCSLAQCEPLWLQLEAPRLCWQRCRDQGDGQRHQHLAQATTLFSRPHLGPTMQPSWVWGPLMWPSFPFSGSFATSSKCSELHTRTCGELWHITAYCTLLSQKRPLNCKTPFWDFKKYNFETSYNIIILTSHPCTQSMYHSSDIHQPTPTWQVLPQGPRWDSSHTI